MELDSVLIGLGMLIVFMAPVYLLIQSGKRKKQKRIKAFKDFANGFGLKLNEVSSWSNTYLMATDKEGTTVFYANGNDSTQPYQRIELANKSRCEVVTEARTLKNGKETSRVIDRIVLRLDANNAQSSSEKIIVFDAHSDPSLSDQVQIAEEWQQRISVLLKK